MKPERVILVFKVTQDMTQSSKEAKSTVPDYNRIDETDQKRSNTPSLQYEMLIHTDIFIQPNMTHSYSSHKLFPGMFSPVCCFVYFCVCSVWIFYFPVWHVGRFLTLQLLDQGLSDSPSLAAADCHLSPSPG